MSILKENDKVSIKSLNYTFGDISLIKDLNLPGLKLNKTFTVDKIIDTNSQWIDSNNSTGIILKNSPFVWNELDLIKFN